MGVLDMGAGPPLAVRPEYIPNNKLPPAGAEPVLQVLQAARRQADAVETVDVPLTPVPVDPGAGHLHDLAPFGPGDGLEGAAEAVSPAGLHLHERHQRAAPRHHIDLAPPGAEAVCRDFKPTAAEVADRRLLGGEPPPMARVRPAGGIAAEATRHRRKLATRQRAV